MLGGRKMRDTLAEATEKAGTLVMAALAVACTALLIALTALVVGLKVRNAAG